MQQIRRNFYATYKHGLKINTSIIIIMLVYYKHLFTWYKNLPNDVSVVIIRRDFLVAIRWPHRYNPLTSHNPLTLRCNMLTLPLLRTHTCKTPIITYTMTNHFIRHSRQMQCAFNAKYTTISKNFLFQVRCVILSINEFNTAVFEIIITICLSHWPTIHATVPMSI